jgi:8-oxo-dGTP diphosphatase
MTDPVLAAGAVLWRPAANGIEADPIQADPIQSGRTEAGAIPAGPIEVCVVHRPAYDDWSLPKGTLADGEHPLLAALREVLEETGLRGEPELRLPDVSYTLPDGVPKTVQFWAMRAGDAAAVPIADPTEVDEIAWLTPAQAARRLSYPTDADLVARVAALPAVTALTLLVRHAHAGERRNWSGNDALRPIDALGQKQSERLAEVLAAFRPERLSAATPLRCKQTLEPLAARLSLPIVTDSAFAEPAELQDVPARAKVAAGRLGELRSGHRAVICSQGKLIPPLLAELAGAGDPEAYKTPKGGGWVLSWSGVKLAGLARL